MEIPHPWVIEIGLSGVTPAGCGRSGIPLAARCLPWAFRRWSGHRYLDA
jgi:hypothetical protein